MKSKQGWGRPEEANLILFGRGALSAGDTESGGKCHAAVVTWGARVYVYEGGMIETGGGDEDAYTRTQRAEREGKIAYKNQFGIENPGKIYLFLCIWYAQPVLSCTRAHIHSPLMPSVGIQSKLARRLSHRRQRRG